MPIEIADSEKIVRAIMSPYHFNQKTGKLRPGAFRSEPGTDEVSVIRQVHKGSDFCKEKALEIASKTAKKTFKGFAVLVAAEIKRVGAQVFDSRRYYCGHAHISYGILAPPPDEPQDSETNKLLLKMTRAVLGIAKYYEDPDPATATWTGPPL